MLIEVSRALLKAIKEVLKALKLIETVMPEKLGVWGLQGEFSALLLMSFRTTFPYRIFIHS